MLSCDAFCHFVEGRCLLSFDLADVLPGTIQFPPTYKFVLKKLKRKKDKKKAREKAKPHQNAPKPQDPGLPDEPAPSSSHRHIFRDSSAPIVAEVGDIVANTRPRERWSGSTPPLPAPRPSISSVGPPSLPASFHTPSTSVAGVEYPVVELDSSEDRQAAFSMSV